MSPRTSFDAGIIVSLPSLMTVAVGADIFLSASSECSARLCWITPTAAFNITIISIIIGSAKSPRSSRKEVANDTPLAMSRTITVKSLNCSKNSAARLFFFLPRSRFSPSLPSLFSASRELKPLSASLPSFSTASAALIEYRSIFSPLFIESVQYIFNLSPKVYQSY